MPLVIITGYPCSGKTTRALQLREFFIQRIAAAQVAQKSGLSLPSTPRPGGEDGDNVSSVGDLLGGGGVEPAEIARIARLKVHLVSVDSLGIDREVYREARSEKEARATEYSAIKRFLSQDDIVIADSLNYIKGYRYQLYCEAKAVLTPSCVVHIAAPADQCRQWNSSRAIARGDPSSHHPNSNSPLSSPKTLMYITPVEGEPHPKQLTIATPPYAEDVLENLIFRYEEPDGRNRWDSPLFTVPWMDEKIDCEAIWEAMVGKGRGVVRANLATVMKPAREADYLQELDRTTQEIVSLVIEAQKNGIVGGELKVPDCIQSIQLPPSTVSLPQLQRIRRQYISLNRQHTQAKSRIKELFVGYLNTNFF